MKDNEWISVEDSLPGIKTKVELKAQNPPDFIFEFEASLSELKNINHITHWRPVPEKRPDFSKLRKGDLINVELNYADEAYVGLFLNVDISEIRILVFHESCHGKGCSMCHAGIFFTGIKKITRINLEEKTFEEI